MIGSVASRVGWCAHPPSDSLVDELHLAVAPFFVGQPEAPRFVAGGVFPWNTDRRMRLEEVRQMCDVVLLRYLLPAAEV